MGSVRSKFVRKPIENVQKERDYKELKRTYNEAWENFQKLKEYDHKVFLQHEKLQESSKKLRDIANRSSHFG
jgi:F0F1-type ATP synthase membrane subunit b/b'